MEKTKQELPENAFRELKPGETYEPVMPSKANPREVTAWSLCLGLLMAVIFSAATAYLGLKVGQVFEAAIPITIIAVGLAGATKRKDPLGENVIIQSIGACSGMIVAGAIFTLPALYILQNKFPDADISVTFLEVFLSSLLGGIIGILFLIPFRKYFVKDMHGKYPFPEATASTQVLMSGEGGSGSAKPLVIASIIGGIFDFLVATFGAWAENFTSTFCSLGVTVAEKAKLFFSINTSAALLGMGYIVGLKYAAIMCAGSVLIWWIVVPAIALIWPDLQISGSTLAANASPQELFQYAKSIGIGAIAMAGIIGVWNSRSVIMSSFSLISKVAPAKNAQEGGADMTQEERTQRDISMKTVGLGLLIAFLVTTLFFYLDVMHGSLLFTIVALLIVAVSLLMRVLQVHALTDQSMQRDIAILLQAGGEKLPLVEVGVEHHRRTPMACPREEGHLLPLLVKHALSLYQLPLLDAELLLAHHRERHLCLLIDVKHNAILLFLVHHTDRPCVEIISVHTLLTLEKLEHSADIGHLHLRADHAGVVGQLARAAHGHLQRIGLTLRRYNVQHALLTLRTITLRIVPNWSGILNDAFDY